MDFSFTDINNFNKCRFLYQALKVKGWKQTDSQPKIVGDLVHVGLASHMRRENVVDAMIAKHKEYVLKNVYLDEEVINEALDNAYKIVPRVVRILSANWETYTATDLTPIYANQSAVQFNFIERQIEVPVPAYISPSSRVKGIVDWVATEKSTQQVWLFDYKVRSSIEPDISEDYNLQMAMYQYMLMKMGVPVVGSICLQIRSTPMVLPKLNVNGSMSRADIVCDWPSYKQCVVAAGLNPDEYQDMQLKLENKKFVHMSKCYRSDKLLEQIWDWVVEPNLQDMATLIRDSQEYDFKAPRHMGSMCKLCGVVDRCQNDLRGLEDDLQVTLEE